MMDNPTFNAKRATKTYRQTINASPQTVFPLLCPVREAEWLDGWQYTMIYSESGLVEKGAVFSTSRKGEPDTVWVVTEHDRDKYLVEFTRFTPQSRTCRLTIAVHPRDERNSYVDIDYEYTGLSPSGNDFIDHLTDSAFHTDMRFWEDSMNHFLKTGKKLS